MIGWASLDNLIENGSAILKTGNKNLMAVNRSNDDWRRDLIKSGQAQEAALADLRWIIMRGVRYALS